MATACQILLWLFKVTRLRVAYDVIIKTE